MFATCRDFVQDGDNVLYDGGQGVGLKDNLWLCPKGGHNRVASKFEDCVLDAQIRTARTIVEQSYKRIKSKWPIFDKWCRLHKDLFHTWLVATALVNIDIATGYPLRHTCSHCCSSCSA